MGQGNGALFELGTIEPGEVIRTSDAGRHDHCVAGDAVATRPKSAGIEESGWRARTDRTIGRRHLWRRTAVRQRCGRLPDNVYLYAEPLV
ncbi:hypothetical protein GTA07_19455 [Rhodococcus hoagii]|nr:hypothetical protein [Prescottella equi]